jgi:hypothetical protein
VTATLAGDSNYNGATSTPYAFTIDKAPSTITVTGTNSFTYSGSPQGPATSTPTGSTGGVTYSYVGTGGTIYGPSSTPPTGAGSYTVTATLASDDNFNGAVSDPFAFVIEKAPSTILVVPEIYTYNTYPQGPGSGQTSTTGSSGGVVYEYSGTDNFGNSYGPSSTPPTHAGNYTVKAVLAPDDKF